MVIKIVWMFQELFEVLPGNEAVVSVKNFTVLSFSLLAYLQDNKVFPPSR
jgi:hypothetical protein